MSVENFIAVVNIVNFEKSKVSQTYHDEEDEIRLVWHSVYIIL